MGTRTRVRRGLEATIGKRCTGRIRAAELRLRRRFTVRPSAPTVDPTTARERRRARLLEQHDVGEILDRRRGGWLPSDPFASFPTPPTNKYHLLRNLHRLVSPRTYLEVGVNRGASLALSRAATVAVDPEFAIMRPLRCDLELVRATSDEFFARADATAHFDGVPVDLAFVDGMHLSEYVLRDFINLERHLAPTALTVLDDVLPRNGLEAARHRLTNAWAGDVYKAAETIARRRPDLLVLFVNTRPTGTAIIVGADPTSQVLTDAYDDELPYLQAEDPQEPPHDYLSRAVAVDPLDLVASEAWPLLVAARESGDLATFERAREILRAIPTLGDPAA